MHQFHIKRGIESKYGKGYRDGDRCFADQDTAWAFATEFGGGLAAHGPRA